MKKKLLKSVLVHPIFSYLITVIILSIISLCLSHLLIPSPFKFTVFMGLIVIIVWGTLFLLEFINNRFMLYCENCKEKCLARYRYCIYCGGETVVKNKTEPERCLNGHKLETYEKYCPKCGAPKRKNE